MRNTDSFLRTATGAAMLVASLLAWPITGAAQLGGLPLPPPPPPIVGGGTTQTVNGIASAVQATTGLGTITTLASTGTLSGLTDAREASQLMGSVPALLSAETLHATALGLSDRIASQASLGNLVLGIGSISIGADAVLAQAEAAAGSATGSSVLGNLTLDGVPVDVSGCKGGSPTFGHLEYIDHGSGLNAHGTSITAYVFQASGFDSKGRPIGVRGICGTARTNQPYGDVNFVVRANDTGEPGTTDEFDIRLVKNGNIVYTTETCFHCWHKLNGGNGGGGNIQLHGPTAGNFSPLDPSTCPANFPGA